MNYINKYFLFFILLAVSVEAIFFSIENKKLNELYLEKENDNKIQSIFENTKLEAKAFSVYDMTEDKKIFGKNDEEEMPIASLTKIMTVIVALNELNPDIDDVVYMPLSSIKQEGDYGISAGEKFKIKDLAKFTLVGSSNDGAYALSLKNSDFLEKMNDKARKIGMSSTLFFNPTGLDIDEGFAGAYASAEDVNKMAVYALKLYPEVFGASILPDINIQSVSGLYHSIKNTDIVLGKNPSIIFSKTGYTPLAGGNLTVIFKDKREHKIAVTVLGSSMKGRFLDVEKIIDTVNEI